MLTAIAEFSRLPPGTTYADVKDDLAYIDNFDSASYDVFRRELHLMFEDGREAALHRADTADPTQTEPEDPADDDNLQKNGQLNPPVSNAAGGKPGDPGFITVLGPDVFYNDPETGLLRPQNLRPASTPRLYQAITELDPDTQDLLLQAAGAFAGGPPMPEGSEWFILLPLFARGGMSVRGALLKAAERKALTKAEAAELRTLVTSGVGKRAYASSLGSSRRRV